MPSIHNAAHTCPNEPKKVRDDSLQILKKFLKTLPQQTSYEAQKSLSGQKDSALAKEDPQTDDKSKDKRGSKYTWSKTYPRPKNNSKSGTCTTEFILSFNEYHYDGKRQPHKHLK